MSKPDPLCVCGDPLSRHHQFDPGFCLDCNDCKEYTARSMPGPAAPTTPPVKATTPMIPQTSKTQPVRHVASSNWIFMEEHQVLENLCDHPIVLRDEEGNELTLMASPRPAKCGIERSEE